MTTHSIATLPATTAIHPWKDRNSVTLFLAQLFAQVCDKLLALGMVWIITTKGGEEYTPWFLLAGGLPYVLLIQHIPKVIEYFGPLKTTYLCDFVRGILFMVVASIIYFLKLEDSMGRDLIFLLMGLNFLSSVGGAYFNAAIYTLPTRVAAPEYVQQLSAMVNGCFSIANVLGPLLAALLFAKLGIVGLIYLAGLSFIFAGILELFITMRPLEVNPKKDEEEEKASFKARPFAIFKNNLTIRYMLLTFLGLNFFLVPILLFFPLYAKNFFGGNLDAFVVLETAMGIGMISGSFLLSLFAPPGKFWQKLLLSLGCIGVFYIIFVVSKILWLSAVSVLFIGLSVQFANIIIINFFQKEVRPDEVSSVMTLANFITISSVPLSMLVVGSVVQLLPLSGIALACAVIMLLHAPLSLAIPRIREIKI
ncbi:MAG: MFS transporter [Oligoflexia bacterium]|nr:MFS transporter [Oligoflexia bacterium]